MRSYSEGPNQIAAGFIPINVQPGGQFSSVCVEVTGTWTGSLSLKASLQDGTAPVQMYTEDVSKGTSLGDGKIITAGLYRVASAAIINVFLVPSEDFAPTSLVTVYFVISESLPPISIVGSV